jgi:hypothetical protein
MFGVVVGAFRPRHRQLAAAVVAAGLGLGGCSGSSSTPNPFQTPLSTAQLSSLFSRTPEASNASASAAQQLDFECPGVGIRQGASTLAVSTNPADPSALNMRYQVGIGQTARECKLTGNTVTIRVGVQGRVVLGPAGGPGQIDVPLRFAVVHEGVEPRAIVSRLQRVSVTVPGGDPNVLFTHIEEDLSFPMPRGGDIDNYVVYVGFDAIAARDWEKKRPAPKPAAKPRRPA